MVMVGADPDELDRIAGQLAAEARRLENLCAQLGRQLHAAPWRGARADRFRHEWTTLHTKRRETLEHSVEDLFGGAGDQSQATFWCGLRPMTPDGTPILGRSPIANLFLNTGHGTLGWTMAAGSGRVLADLVSGKAADIETGDLGYARYQA